MILTATVMKYIPTKAYFYVDDRTKHAFLIDPGAQSEALLKIVRERELIIEKILLTHGHFDHIGAVSTIQKELSSPVCMGIRGREYIENPEWNLSAQTDEPIVLKNVTFLPAGTTLTLSSNPEYTLQIIDSPGHTTDGVIYYSSRDKVAFVGDTIFAGSYGRTDLYGGDESTLLHTIQNVVFKLPDDTILLSGHSEPTTVASEKKMAWHI